MKALLVPLLAVILAAVPPLAAQAQAFPTKPVRITVPFPAGGSTDSLVRIVAERLGARWSQQVLVENKPGAGGNIGAAQFARAPADGYELLAAPPGPLAVNFNLFRGLNYDARQFAPVSMLANIPNVLVLGTHVPAKSVQELIAYAKANPNKLSYATQGNGSTSHLTAVLFQSLTGIEMVHVPYKGSGPALTDMMGGKIDLMFDNLTTSQPFHASKRVNIVAVATRERLAALPEVPTVAESGVPNFESGTWVGLVAPPETPAPVVEQISRVVGEVLREPDVARRFAVLAAEPVGGTPADTRAFLQAEAAKWKRVIDAAQIKPD